MIQYRGVTKPGGLAPARPLSRANNSLILNITNKLEASVRYAYNDRN